MSFFITLNVVILLDGFYYTYTQYSIQILDQKGLSATRRPFHRYTKKSMQWNTIVLK
jgi:hypothetical protein